MQPINLLMNALLVVSFVAITSAGVANDCLNKVTPCVIIDSRPIGQCQAAYKDQSRLDFKTEALNNVWYYSFRDNNPIVFSCEGSPTGTFTEVNFKNGFGTATNPPAGASYTWAWNSGQKGLRSTIKNDAVVVTHSG